MDTDVPSESPSHQRVCSPQDAPEIKICIIVDSKTPVLMQAPVDPGKLTLAQFKNLTNLSNDHYKFYFKSHDSEFGSVKEELVEDDSIVPIEDGEVVAWVLSNDSAQYSLFDPDIVQNQEQPYYSTFGQQSDYGRLRKDRDPNYGLERQKGRDFEEHTIYDKIETEKTRCFLVDLFLDRQSILGLTILCTDDATYFNGVLIDKLVIDSLAWRDGRIKPGDRIVEINGFDLRGLRTSEAISIFREFVDRKGAINMLIERAEKDTSQSISHSALYNQLNNSKNVRPESSGFDPATELPAPVVDSDLLPIPKPHRTLPKITDYRSTYSLPRSISPRSWYTGANIDNLTSGSDLHHPIDSRSVYDSTTSGSLRQIDVTLHCGKDNIYTIYEALRKDAASLDIKDRDWLKVVVKDAFLGSALVKWLSRNVYGFCNRSEVKRFANQMLNLDLIKSPVSNSNFSEKCYYTLT